MARLTPSEILESPETRTAALMEQIRSLEEKLEQRDKEMETYKKSAGVKYRPGRGLPYPFTGEYRNATFEGQTMGGIAILFSSATLTDVLFIVDHDDILVFRNCTLNNVHFTHMPRFIHTEGCVVMKDSVTVPEGWVTDGATVDLEFPRIPAVILENLKHRDNGYYDL